VKNETIVALSAITDEFSMVLHQSLGGIIGNGMEDTPAASNILQAQEAHVICCKLHIESDSTKRPDRPRIHGEYQFLAVVLYVDFQYLNLTKVPVETRSWTVCDVPFAAHEVAEQSRADSISVQRALVAGQEVHEVSTSIVSLNVLRVPLTVVLPDDFQADHVCHIQSLVPVAEGTDIWYTEVRCRVRSTVGHEFPISPELCTYIQAVCGIRLDAHCSIRTLTVCMSKEVENHTDAIPVGSRKCDWLSCEHLAV
jgi:hypothetical protein